MKNITLETVGPIHPGEILLEEFMKPREIDNKKLARVLGLSVGTVENILQGLSDISVNMAESLSAYFGTTTGFWLNLQHRYDEEKAS